MCRILQLFTSIFVLFVLTSAVQAQKTGFADSFEGALKLLPQPYFDYVQTDGQVEIDVNVPGGVKWQGITYEIGDTIDLTEHPFMNLRIKSDFSFQLTAYVYDLINLYRTTAIKIQKSDCFVNYFLDFGDLGSIYADQIVKLQFTPNGNTTDAVRGKIWLDEIRLGTEVVKWAGIGGSSQKLYYKGSTKNRFPLIDISGASEINSGGGELAISDMSISEISENTATVQFSCVPGFIGHDTVYFTAVGSESYQDNTICVPLEIEGNHPPVIDPIPNLDVMVGDTVEFTLSGIGDGNKSVEQPLGIHAFSDNQTALPDSNIMVVYEPDATIAGLKLIPIAAGENMQLTIVLDDSAEQSNLTEIAFHIDSYQDFNHPPTLDIIPDQFTYLDFGEQIITLTGIGDGDNGQQELQFTFFSSDQSVVSDDDITIEFSADPSEAQLSYLPSSHGTTTISLVLLDNGGNAGNNGDMSIERNFEIEVGLLPPEGLGVPVSDFGTASVTELVNPGDWMVESYGSNQIATLGSFHGRDNVIKIEAVNKSCWTGLWYMSEELNLDQHRYMVYDIFVEGNSFSNGAKTHGYLWDVDDKRNLPRAHQERKNISAGKWHTVFMDYRGKGGMETDEGDAVNVQRINRLLINYATDFSFPFPVDNGNVYITNIMVGNSVPDSLVPGLKPVCTIEPVADQLVFEGSGGYTIALSGITAGEGNETIPTVLATSDNPDLVANPDVSAVTAEGKADLQFQTGTGTGRVVITLAVSAEGSDSKTISFDINIVNTEADDAVWIRLDPKLEYQTIRGFGTFQFSARQNYIDYYTEDLGASAIRTGIISNQIEPVNDNDDPYILDLDAFDYSAFDFNYYRQLKEKGVETFILTSWSPPAWMKRNLSVSYGYAEAPNYYNTDNILEPYYYDEFAETMVAAVMMFKNEAGIDLYAVGPQNEPAFNEPYASAVLNPGKFAELVTWVGDAFASYGINTKIYMPEQVFSQSNYSMSTYINALSNNSRADFYTDVIATHSYGEDGVEPGNPTYPGWTELWDQSQSCTYPKELWMSETYPLYTNWNSALSLAGAIHGALVYGNVSLWTLWDIEGTLMDKGNPTPAFYTSKNYYKYIRPGAVRIDVSENNDDILASSFIDRTHHRLTTVLINKAIQPLKISVVGDSIPAEYDVYLTAEYINFEFQGTHPAGGMIVLPPKSVVTLLASTAGDLVTAMEEEAIPAGFQLYQNYPNPFNPETIIRFSLGKPLHTKISIYNVLGQKIATIVDGNFDQGIHQVNWQGRNDQGRTVASGLYFYKLEAGEFIKTKKCLLIR